MPIYQPTNRQDFVHRIYAPKQTGSGADLQRVRRVYEIQQDDFGDLRPVLVYSNYDISYNWGEGDSGAEIDQSDYKMVNSETWGHNTKFPPVNYTDNYAEKFNERDGGDYEIVDKVFSSWNTEISDESDSIDEGFVKGDEVTETGVNNYKEYTLYAPLQRSCVGNLTNSQETTDYVPEEGSTSAIEANSLAESNLNIIISEENEKMIEEDISPWILSGAWLSTANVREYVSN